MQEKSNDKVQAQQQLRAVPSSLDDTPSACPLAKTCPSTRRYRLLCNKQLQAYGFLTWPVATASRFEHLEGVSYVRSTSKEPNTNPNSTGGPLSLSRCLQIPLSACPRLIVEESLWCCFWLGELGSPVRELSALVAHSVYLQLILFALQCLDMLIKANPVHKHKMERCP